MSNEWAGPAGQDITDDNEADALWILEYARQNYTAGAGGAKCC